MPDDNAKLVYSTDKAVPRKEKPSVIVPCQSSGPAGQKVILRLERKGRGGKSVTVVEGFGLPEKEKEKLLRQLKGKLGAGGTASADGLELQGDHRDALMTLLTAMGYRPKRSGG